jgi:hypothetical protein
VVRNKQQFTRRQLRSHKAGTAAMAKLTPDQRIERGKLAASKRWANHMRPAEVLAKILGEVVATTGGGHV